MPLDAHAKPPAALKAAYKRYQRLSTTALNSSMELVDLQRGLNEAQLACMPSHPLEPGGLRVQELFAAFTGADTRLDENQDLASPAPVSYLHDSFPGLRIVPSLLPLCIQKEMLVKLLHRDLANPKHKTNIHFHHDLEYPRARGCFSFFDFNPYQKDIVLPKARALHEPFSVDRFLNKKLRWCTLGGQYDWTQKTYPPEEPPAFPGDVQQLLHGLFPETMPEAAIVNVYSPGDVLSLHRDVSEECGNGLVSISIGCDAIFMVALDCEQDNRNGPSYLAMRLRSGDVVYMDGRSRYAWHGVPRIIPDTCPRELQSWPAMPGVETGDCALADPYRPWRYWLASKRINLNVRQMRDYERRN